MKRIIAVVISVMMLTAFMSVGVYAGTPEEDIIASARLNIPQMYEQFYMVPLEHALEQLHISKADSEYIIGLIETTSATVFEDKGHTLHLYDKLNMSLMVESFDKLCDCLDLTYELEPVPEPDHIGDVIAMVYNADGSLIAELDGDIINKTAVPDKNYLPFCLIGGCILLAAALPAFWVCRKYLAPDVK